MIFLFTEGDDRIFCPTTYLVSIAIVNDVIQALSLSTAKRVINYDI
jgi:hypothetical protein